MKIFLASHVLDEIRRATDAGLVDGIALSDAARMDDDGDAEAKEKLVDISREFALPVCITVPAVTSEDIYKHARELAKISDHVVVQIPFVEDAIVPIRRLTSEGVSVCATFIYNGVQALLAAKCGAAMVTVAIDELESQGQCCSDVIAETRAMLNAADVECDLIAGAATSAKHFTDVALAGADTIIVTSSVLSALMVHSLTDRGLDKFLRDLSRRHKNTSSPRNGT